MPKHSMEYYQYSYSDALVSTDEIKKGSVAFVEPVIRFLERDPYEQGSGYLKEKIWRYLLRVELSKKQKVRLRQIALHYIQTRISREFFPMCRFIRSIADDHFEEQVRELEKSSDPKIQHRALIMAAYLRSISEGENARFHLFLNRAERGR